MPFEEELRRAQDEVEEQVEKTVAQTALAILSAVTLATPVGNPALWEQPDSAPAGYSGGNARGNWQLGINTPPADVLNAKDPSGAGTINKGRSTVRGYRLGPSIIIANNVPYIQRLNEGSSTQAPAGFVEKAAQAATNAVETGSGPRL